jgi:hypothetical protein
VHIARKKRFSFILFLSVKPKETSRTHIPGAVCQFAIRAYRDTVRQQRGLALTGEAAKVKEIMSEIAKRKAERDRTAGSARRHTAAGRRAAGGASHPRRFYSHSDLALGTSPAGRLASHRARHRR